MGRTCDIEAEPAPEAAVLHFKQTGKAEDGPSVDRFRPDFSEKRPERSLWNLRLVEVFTNDYVQKGLPLKEVKEVSRFFLEHLTSLQARHRRLSRTAASGRGTVHDEFQRRRRIEERKKTVRSIPFVHVTILTHLTKSLLLPAVSKSTKRFGFLWHQTICQAPVYNDAYSPQ